MAEVVLVRHAATTWSGRRYCGRSDPPLSRAGRSVAAQVAVALQATLGPGIRIVTSPRRRAVQTARAIAAALGTGSFELDARWAEIDFGVADGLTFDELARTSPDLAERLAAGEIDVDWPGGERAAALTARVQAAWREVSSLDEVTLVVTHGGPMRVTIALATGRPPTAIAIPEPGGVWRHGSAVSSPHDCARRDG